MYLHKPDKYKKKIRSYIQMYATPDKLEASESKPNPFLSFLPILNPIPTLARFYPILAKFTSMACLRLALLRKVLLSNPSQVHIHGLSQTSSAPQGPRGYVHPQCVLLRGLQSIWTGQVQ
ncbi:uncharacterized protein LOC108253593 isoform X1 [Diaphorina citri]|uniref:Uncharacterized protein LOC108253593 isoform X1 n=1 Tax=Diaphorina citri TaxID=121845 RepID=A0A1S4EMN8_DIACI|nr:uncharacterized protein LOC108253593 isoform X1 [Diaphorina citri]